MDVSDFFVMCWWTCLHVFDWKLLIKTGYSIVQHYCTVNGTRHEFITLYTNLKNHRLDCSFLNHVYDWTVHVYTYWYLIIASESNRSGVLKFKVCLILATVDCLQCIKRYQTSEFSWLFTVYKEIPNIWV